MQSSAAQVDVPAPFPVPPITLLGPRFLVVPDTDPDPGERKSRGGIYIPDTVADKSNVRAGRIAAMGPGMMKGNGTYWTEIQTQVAVGDRILYNKNGTRTTIID